MSTPSTQPTPNCYEILSIPQTANLKDINSAYKRLALKHHPDKTTGDGSSYEFQKIQEAVEILRDPYRRLDHDREINTTRRTSIEERIFFDNDYTGWRPASTLWRKMHTYQERYMYSYRNSVHMDPYSKDSREERERCKMGEWVWAESEEMAEWRMREARRREAMRARFKSDDEQMQKEEEVGEDDSLGRCLSGDCDCERMQGSEGTGENGGYDEDKGEEGDEYEGQDGTNNEDGAGNEDGKENEDDDQKEDDEEEDEGDEGDEGDTDKEDEHDDEKDEEENRQEDQIEDEDEEEDLEKLLDKLMKEAERKEQEAAEELETTLETIFEATEDDHEGEKKETTDEMLDQNSKETEHKKEAENDYNIPADDNIEEIHDFDHNSLARVSTNSTGYETTKEYLESEANTEESNAGDTVFYSFSEEEDSSPSDSTDSEDNETSESEDSTDSPEEPQAGSNSIIAPFTPYFEAKLRDSSGQYTQDDMHAELRGIMLETFCGWLEDLRLTFPDTQPTEEGNTPQECRHLGYWKKEYGHPECEMCYRRKPIYTLTCPGCGIKACVRCKFE